MAMIMEALAGDPFYVAGGTLRSDAACYVERPADDELFHALRRGELSYVLTARQMGKSSLKVRIAARLRQDGIRVVLLDLTAIGQNLTPDQWYRGIAATIAEQLEMEGAVDEFWRSQTELSPFQKLTAVLRQVALPQSEAPLVVFVDEIDVVRSLPFSADEWFAGIRAIHNARAEDPSIGRLTFCLLGVAAPTDLVRDARITPFNIGHRIDLGDFTEAEAAPLARGLCGSADARRGALHVRPGTPERLLQRILHWTGGHPYLTQRLCQAVAAYVGGRQTEAPDGRLVDRTCAELFLSHRARERDDNLVFVRERLLRSEADTASLLERYRRIRAARRVPDDESDPLVELLRLAGIVRSERGLLRVRNRIYARVFDRRWASESLPDAEIRRQRSAYRRGVLRAASLAMAVIVVIAAFAVGAIRSARESGRSRRLANARARLYAEERNRAASLAATLAESNGRLRSALRAATEARRQAQRAEGRAAAQRAVAVAMGQRAEQARRKAESRTSEARETLVRLDVLTGRTLEDAGDMSGALLRYAEAARLDHADSSRVQLDALRFDLALQKAPRLTGAWWDSFRAVTVAPDGRRILTVDTSDHLTWHDLDSGASGRLNLPLQPGEKPYTFSQGGPFLLTTPTPSSERVWDLRTGRPASPILAHPRPLLRWRSFLGADGGRLITVTDDGVTRSWDVQSARCVVAGRADPVRAISPDGRWAMASVRGPRAGTPMEWRMMDTRAGVVARVSAQFAEPAFSPKAYFSPNGQRLLLTGGPKPLLFPRIIEAPRPVWLDLTVCYCGAFSPDNRLVVAGGVDTTARVWDAETGEPVTPVLHHGSPILSVAFSRDGQRVLTGGDDGIRIWDVRSGAPAGPLIRSAGTVMSVVMPDANHIVAVSPNAGMMSVWRLPEAEAEDLTGPALPRAAGMSSSVTTDALGKPFYLVHAARVALWKTLLSQGTSSVPWRRGNCGAVSPDGTRAALACADGAVRIYDTRSGRLAGTLPRAIGRIRALAYSPGGRFLISCGNDGRARIWRAAALTLSAQTRDLGKPITNAAFSPDGRWVALRRGEQATIWDTWLWDLRSGSAMLVPNSACQCYLAATFSPDGRHLLAPRGTLAAAVWDIRARSASLPLLQSTDWVEAGDFSPDGRYVATGGDDGEVRVWNVQTGRPAGSPMKHVGGVDSLDWSPDGRMIVSGGDDGTIRLWDARTGESIGGRSLGRPVSFVSFSPTGRAIAAATDLRATVWRLPKPSASVPQMLLLARVYANQRIRLGGGSVPLSPAELRRAWGQLRAHR